MLEKLRKTFWTSYLIVINQIIDWFKAKSNKIEEKIMLENLFKVVYLQRF